MAAPQVIRKRLKSLRVKRGLTQEELSARTELNPAYISYIEHGKRNPTIPTLQKLCKGLGISLEDLFKGL